MKNSYIVLLMDQYVCLGQSMTWAKKLGYDDEKIHKLIRAIYEEFDWKAVAEAKKIYWESDY